ncbi:MAG TPA: hypothetical protein VGH65_02250, partial [Verrucomicrobiaceae bacterium]
MPDSAPAAARPSTFVGRLVSTVILWALIVIALNFRLDWPLVVMVATFGMLGSWEYVRLQRDDSGARPYGILLLLVAAVYWLLVSWRGFHSRTLGLGLTPQPEAIPLWIDMGMLLIMVHGTFLLTMRWPLEGERTLR